MTVDMQFIKIKYQAEESSRFLMQCRLWYRDPYSPDDPELDHTKSDSSGMGKYES